MNNSARLIESSLSLIIPRKHLRDPIVAKILATYQTPKRKYHTLERIVSMLRRAHKQREQQALFHSDDELEQWQQLLIAICYLDLIVHIPSHKNWSNRYLSASHATNDLRGLQFHTNFIEGVVQAIRSTDQHTLEVVDSEHHAVAATLIDLDLLSTGLLWHQFTEETKRLQSELKHLNQQQFRLARVLWAERLLDRSELFFSPIGQPYEQRARYNLTRLLQLN